MQTHDIEEVLRYLGGPRDDAENYFTLRMLMILESRCVYGDKSYESALRALVSSYYRDFDGNRLTFQPWFLINDIMRYWKTLLLNYENRRSGEADPKEQTEARAKNFKLRFSRSTTCFATIAALVSIPEGPSPDDVYELALLTPQQRLRFVQEKLPATGAIIDEVMAEYSWFLTQTSLSKEELHARLENDETRKSMFERAENYGRKIFDLLTQIDVAKGTEPNLIRYLVV